MFIANVMYVNNTKEFLICLAVKLFSETAVWSIKMALNCTVLEKKSEGN